jgi:hypothetical protein
MLSVVIVPGILLVIGILVCAWRRARNVRALSLDDLFGPAQYDFAKSFAANFSLLGAIIGSLLGATALPVKDDKVYAGDFAALHFTLLLITVAGPYVYNALRREHQQGKELVYHGTVRALLAGVAIIGVGALSQAIALIHVATVTIELRAELEATMIAFIAVALTTLLGMTLYLYQSTVSTLLHAVKPVAQAKGTGSTDAQPTDAQVSASPWTVP